MDPNGHIYRALADEIPAEDKARLDGYLYGRAEADKAERFKERMAKLERELAAARAFTREPPHSPESAA